jgi:purine-nucleoside phosphorylase
MLEQIRQATEYIQLKTNFRPQFGIVLGTGLGALVNDVRIEYTLEYSEIPNFPLSTVESHHGKLIFGTLNNTKVVVMQGRFHYYEGYNMQQITFPIRVMRYLGIERLFLSNACGGLNPAYKISDLMILNDHINLLPGHPLTGKNIPELGPRFPDMSVPYDPEMIATAMEIGEQHGIKLHAGVYAAVSGPCLETPAEYKYLRIIGADVVGMSTVPEVIVARHMNLPCFAVSVITDIGIEGLIKEVSIDDVIEAANIAQPKMTLIMKELIGRLQLKSIPHE